MCVCSIFGFFPKYGRMSTCESLSVYFRSFARAGPPAGARVSSRPCGEWAEAIGITFTAGICAVRREKGPFRAVTFFVRLSPDGWV